MKTRKIQLIVILNPPIHADDEDVITYVSDAIKSHSGSLHPLDPMFYLNRDTVIVAIKPKPGRKHYNPNPSSPPPTHPA